MSKINVSRETPSAHRWELNQDQSKGAISLPVRGRGVEARGSHHSQPLKPISPENVRFYWIGLLCRCQGRGANVLKVERHAGKSSEVRLARLLIVAHFTVLCRISLWICPLDITRMACIKLLLCRKPFGVMKSLQ
ncbi:hypothetical protein GJAV_G00186340 [Gymnothorax javanicus]|nr:hypothetical protein GJAV_G00186340 [Gymnothorax javanicus]